MNINRKNNKNMQRKMGIPPSNHDGGSSPIVASYTRGRSLDIESHVVDKSPIITNHIGVK